MTIKNAVSIDFFVPRLSIVKSVFDCSLPGVIYAQILSLISQLCEGKKMLTWQIFLRRKSSLICLGQLTI